MLMGALALLACAWETSAQVPVVEANGTGRSSSQASNAEPNNQVLVDLYLRVDALQNEVLNLRGIVEEQSYQIRRMEEEQRDRYLDLDRRLSAIASGGAAPGTPASGVTGGNAAGASPTTPLSPAGGPTAPVDGIGVPSQRNNTPLPATGRNSGFTGPGIPPTVTAPGPVAGNQATPASEQELYRTALNLLLEESDYEQAITLFQQYIDNFPTGSYITNAYYWQGEALILVSRYNQAKDVFMKIVSDFPNDPKAPGAMLKLGVVYSRMGDNQLATQVWRDIQTQYPQSLTEIRAAEDYLRRSPN